ncbi:MAG: FKBP-type peptidyl-prolyl cis-trans isomerase [Candidatus Thermoplasmatota archaeon]
MAVKEGDIVKVDYTGKLKDGSIFDSSKEELAKESEFYDESRDYEPLKFKVGKGELIQGFEEGVKGMEVGEEKEVEISPEKAYGEEGEHPLAGKTLIFEIEVKDKE